MSPRAVVPSVLLFSTLAVAAALLLPPKLSGAAQPEAAPAEPALNSANAGELCLRLPKIPRVT
jgi:hypothetical protein